MDAIHGFVSNAAAAAAAAATTTTTNINPYTTQLDEGSRRKQCRWDTLGGGGGSRGGEQLGGRRRWLDMASRHAACEPQTSSTYCK